MTSKRPNKDELKELAGPSSSSSECEHDDDDSIDRDGAGEDDESVEDEWKHDADDEYSADELGRGKLLIADYSPRPLTVCPRYKPKKLFFAATPTVDSASLYRK
jgi:hypothetical protein